MQCAEETIALVAGEKDGWRSGNEKAAKEKRASTGYLPESEVRPASSITGFSDKYFQSP